MSLVNGFAPIAALPAQMAASTAQFTGAPVHGQDQCASAFVTNPEAAALATSVPQQAPWFARPTDGVEGGKGGGSDTPSPPVVTLKGRVREWLREESDSFQARQEMPDAFLHSPQLLAISEHLIAFSSGKPSTVQQNAGYALLLLMESLSPEIVQGEQWKYQSVRALRRLVEIAAGADGGLIRQGLEKMCDAVVSGTAASDCEETRAWKQDLFLRVLNYPDKLGRVHARDFLRSPGWLKHVMRSEIKASHAEQRSIPELLEDLQAERDDARWYRAIEALSGDMWAESTIPLFEVLEGHPSVKARRGAAIALRQLSSPACLDAFGPALRDRDDEVACIAASGLARLEGSPRWDAAINAVIAFLQDAGQRQGRRNEIARAFVSEASQRSVEEFYRLQGHQDPRVAAAARYAFESVKP